VILLFDLFKSKVKIMDKGMFDAREIAAYIKNRYESTGEDKKISPIKLQKALYFCFAYWGAFVMRGKNNPNMSEVNTSDYEENLFKNRIEAWVYGPVVPDVYHEDDILKYYTPNLFNNNNNVREYIDEILNDVLDVSDFRLVEISHCDNCWKKNFSSFSFLHNKEIPKKQIINEYEKKHAC
jgi:uncharacterized phage-associated protein